MSAKAKRRRVRFQMRADEGIKVSVAGTFNGWDPEKHVLKPKDGMYALNILLDPGHYEYKVVVNGVWCVDPERSDWAPNEYGSLNSVIVVE